MDHTISRSEQKRRVKDVEGLAAELVTLSVADIKRLPCDDQLKVEIKNTAVMKAGSRRRQIKFIAKQIRQGDFEPLYDFLAEKKGSKLKENKAFHELERLRDDIITEAIAAARVTEEREDTLDAGWHSTLISRAADEFPGLDPVAVKAAAISYAKSRKPVYGREIFRLLKAAMEQRQFAGQQ